MRVWLSLNCNEAGTQLQTAEEKQTSTGYGHSHPFFQQLTAVNDIMFYTLVMFSTIRFGQDASLYSIVITGAVNVVATFVSIATVNRVGQRVMFLEGGVQMFVS